MNHPEKPTDIQSNRKQKYMSRQFRRRKRSSFNPNRQYVTDAIEEFLSSGGKIKQLEAQKEANSANSWLVVEDNQEADEFLQD